MRYSIDLTNYKNQCLQVDMYNIYICPSTIYMHPKAKAYIQKRGGGSSGPGHSEVLYVEYNYYRLPFLVKQVQ